MRNPVRVKNLQLRFLPAFALGAATLALARPTRWSFGAGAATVVVGAALRSWGAGHLVKNRELTLSGPYAHMRHPLYAGSLLVGAGFCLIAGGELSALLLAFLLPWFLLLYFPRKERIESARLERRYGAAYARYRESVPALVPRLRAWTAPPASAGVRWSGERYAGNNELGTVLALAAALGIFALRSVASW